MNRRSTRRAWVQACGLSLVTPAAALLRSVAASDTAARQGFSLHLGVNRVDTTKYPPIAPLAGCVRDASTYREIANRSHFIKSKLLADQQATRQEVLRHIYWAAELLRPGDLFFLTYSGHGGQLPDRSGDEEDGHDETWCLYDGQLRDDLLHRAWRQFRRGVRILVISDSCHSGTVARIRGQLQVMLRALDSNWQWESVPGLDSERLSQTRAALRQTLQEPGVRVRGNGSQLQFRAITASQAEADYQSRRGTADDYDRDGERSSIGNTRAVDPVEAQGLLLAACQDWQLAWEAGGQGLFTSQLWDLFDRGVNSSYQEFLQSIGRRMPPNQTPNLFSFGQPNTAFTTAQIPFTI